MNRAESLFCKFFLAPIIKKIFIKEIKGLENVPASNFILVSNHQSHLDIIISAFLCLPRRFHFIGQIDGFKIPLKWLIRSIYFLSGVIPLDRQNKESRKKVILQAIKVLKKRDILIIYPEGKRSLNGEIQGGKLGIAKIFLKTGIPIIPAALHGTFEILPPKGKLKIKKIVKVNIGKPLYFEEEFAQAQKIDENSEEYKDILKKITNRVMAEVAYLKSFHEENVYQFC